jgi:hypothetical protein
MPRFFRLHMLLMFAHSNKMNSKHFLPLILLIGACGKKAPKTVVLDNDILSQCNTAIQNAIVVDRVPAPVGGRRYFFASVAAYESLVPFYKEYTTLSGQLNGLKAAPMPDTSKSYCLDLVAMAAHTYASKKLVFKEDSIINFRTRKLKEYKSKLSSDQYENSISYGDSVGAHIAKWAAADNYAQTRGTDFYLLKKEPGKWQPTLPEYGEAVEPNWGKLRPAGIPKADLIQIQAPEPYSENKNSRFYTIVKEVFDQSKKNDSTDLLIAKYWDDNPNSVVHIGHATYNVLKVSPAGHWLGIFSTVARQKNFTLIQRAEGFARLSAGIHDAFIICWHTKYVTEYIRPETAIRKMIDSSWLPYIETPAFPEYPSGHSVVSSCAATILTATFGEFSFIDSTELEFGLGTRKFKNFREASNEACMSRLYGGIHFIDGIEKGREMGNKLGEYHLTKITTRKQ